MLFHIIVKYTYTICLSSIFTESYRYLIYFHQVRCYMCVCKNLILKEFYDLNRLIELSFKYIFHNDISPHFKFLLSTQRLYFSDFFNKRSKGLTIPKKKKSQPSLIIFTKGADMFGNDCISIRCLLFTNNKVLKSRLI